ncbi:putative transcription factor interactor and regulator CCHC(Zn) family [Rosa chinensis]|uniref:Putative transcription factor interactor and regulator CCHC(Zn) family n=1 Tax=Rosa chinensis TaxID=74649 RepID=A0A2P6RYU5_ROSCH|nr:putative transcription factor interactor and regulator CCHC(Zn) family [Rosa chinensis]
MLQRKRFRQDNDLRPEFGSMHMEDLGSGRQSSPTLTVPKSYASTLKNPSARSMQSMVEDLELTDEDCSYSPGKHGLNVSFSHKVHNKLDFHWRCAVIVKLMGKPNSVNAFEFMLGGLHRKWKLKGGWSLIDLPNDFYIVKFNLEEDMNEILCGGPWILAGQTLVVQKWRPNFDPMTEKICKMAMWVRICGLPVKLFKNYTVAKIGKILGEVIKVDQVTLAQARGKFARVCIEVDLNKPLRPFVEVENMAYRVVYEGISMICFECGCYGHVKDQCPSVQNNNQAQAIPTKNSDPNQPAKSTPEANMEDNSQPDRGNGQQDIVTMNTAIVKEDMGPWMLMTYKQQKKNNNGNGSTSRNHGGSRFNVLQELNEEEKDEKNGQETNASDVPTLPDLMKSWNNPQAKTKHSKLHAEPKGEKVDNGKKRHALAANDKNTKEKGLARVPMKDVSNFGNAGSSSKTKVQYQRKNKALSTCEPPVQCAQLTNPTIISMEQNVANSCVAAEFGHCPPEELLGGIECLMTEVVVNATNVVDQTLMFKVLCWNVRGAGGKKFRSAISNLIHYHKVDILIISEPRVPFSRVHNFFRKNGFPNAEISEAAGFSGGVWVLYDKNNIEIQYIDNNSQSVTVKVAATGSHEWILSAIYASPTNSVRSCLWHYLSTFADQCQLPWLVIGDCNELYCSADKNGGSLVGKIGGMKTWADNYGMVDVGYQGPDFTWSNNRIKERLDRGFCNDLWRLKFPDAFLQHLPKMKSDHCPLLLHSNSYVNSTNAEKPFRFQAMWMSHDQYSDFITNHWKEYSGVLQEKVSSLARDLKEWNSKTFGNIFKKKRRLLARIAGIQKCLCRNNNSYLLNLEQDLIKEYELICDQEAMYWQQKSRVKWLQEGDKNTKFFHLSTMIRRRRNKIEGLLDANGALCHNLEEMKDIAAGFFEDLFTYKMPADSRFVIPYLFLALESHELQWMNRDISSIEVKAALFNIGGLKTPGADGFPAIFYQNHWNIFADEILDLVT